MVLKQILSFSLFIVILFVAQTTKATNKDSLIEALSTKGISECQQKKYKEAEQTFKQLFVIKKAVIPNDVAYYYGVCTFFQKKYKPSKKAFLRYKTFFEANDSLKKEADEFIADMDCYEKGYFEYTEKCSRCNGLGNASEDCQTCKGTGRQYCPTCSGSGVAVSKSSFGDNYSTCNRCGGKGVLDCTICKGTLKMKRSCSVCGGKGTVIMKGVCHDEE